MKKNKIYPISLRIAVHIHATEGEKKVLQAIKNILPHGVDIPFKKEVFVGYYGNQIIRLEGVLRKPRIVKEIFRNIITNIKGFTYPSWIVERFEKKQNSLYIRLDKQAAYNGEIKLGWGDDIIHLIFKFPGYISISGRELEAFIEQLRKEKSEQL